MIENIVNFMVVFLIIILFSFIVCYFAKEKRDKCRGALNKMWGKESFSRKVKSKIKRNIIFTKKKFFNVKKFAESFKVVLVEEEEEEEE